jgi:hypothetical protein
MKGVNDADRPGGRHGRPPQTLHKWVSPRKRHQARCPTASQAQPFAVPCQVTSCLFSSCYSLASSSGSCRNARYDEHSERPPTSQFDQREIQDWETASRRYLALIAPVIFYAPRCEQTCRYSVDDNDLKLITADIPSQASSPSS